MSEIEGVKRALEGVIEIVKVLKGITEEKRRSLLARAQLIYNIVVQNEKKIWLKTSDLNSSSVTLLEVVEQFKDEVELEAALANVESQTRKIEEEIRRRSMVVT
jgi:CRISPR/Cas system-associated protein Csx1